MNTKVLETPSNTRNRTFIKMVDYKSRCKEPCSKGREALRLERAVL